MALRHDRSQPGRLLALPWCCEACVCPAPMDPRRVAFGQCLAGLLRVRPSHRRRLAMLDLWGGTEASAWLAEALPSAAGLQPALGAAWWLRARGPASAEALALAAITRRLCDVLVVLSAEDLLLETTATSSAAPDLLRVVRRQSVAVLGLCCAYHEAHRPAPFARGASAGRPSEPRQARYLEWAERQPAR